MGLRFYIMEGRPLTFDSLTQEQADAVKEFLFEDVIGRRQDEVIAYYALHILEDDLEDCPPLVKEFLTEKIRENGGSLDVTFAT